MIREEDVLTVAQIRSAVAPVLAGERVCFAYLFGSHATGKQHIESDIDIAVYADPTLSKDERFELWKNLYAPIERALGIVERDKVDLSMLQDTSTLLQFNVIQEKCVLFERSRSERILYEWRVWQQYEDERYWRERQEEHILSRILSLSVKP